MRPKAQFLPPRQAVIYAVTRRMLDETAVNAASFSMSVAEHYCRMTAPDVRHVALKLGDGDDLFMAMRRNAETVRRYMDGTVKSLPVDLEDAWVLALPEPYRSECERDLAQRRGRLSIVAPQGGKPDKIVGLANLATEFGQLLDALAPALADGKITAADYPYAKRILGESDDLITAVLSLRRQITEILPMGEVA